jgi:uncharacterized protein with HEPN domain
MHEPKPKDPSQNMMLPNLVLSEQALHYLSEARNYANLINTLYSGKTKELINDLSLQNAIIFCLKALGTLIGKAAKSLGITKLDNFPLFWRNMSYLRNNLIHHCYSSCITQNCSENFENICKRSNQIIEYLTLCIDTKNTHVDLGGKKFKVFIDFYALCGDLEKAFPKEKRHKLPQQFYTQVILDALEGINSLLKGKGTVTEELFSKLKINNPIVYYALQNLLELIATTANPNPEFSVMTQGTRDLLNSAHPNTDRWLHDLGESRMHAMHNSIVISNPIMAEHLIDMLKLRDQIFSNFTLKNKLTVALKPEAPIPKELAKGVEAKQKQHLPVISPKEPSLTISTIKNPSVSVPSEPSPVLAKGEAKPKAPSYASLFLKSAAKEPVANPSSLPTAKNKPLASETKGPASTPKPSGKNH